MFYSEDALEHFYRKNLAQSEFVRLSAKKVIETLDDVASSTGQSDCVLVYNIDLLLSGVKDDERQQIWQDLFNRFPGRARVLLVAIPDTAIHLLPSESLLGKWKKDTRLA